MDNPIELKLPADPRELLHLYDLQAKFDLQRELNNNISTYVSEYVISHLRTKQGVLDTIPHEEHHLYIRHGRFASLAEDLAIDESADAVYLIDTKKKRLTKFADSMPNPKSDQEVLDCGIAFRTTWTYEISFGKLYVEYEFKAGTFNLNRRTIARCDPLRATSHICSRVSFDMKTNTITDFNNYYGSDHRHQR